MRFKQYVEMRSNEGLAYLLEPRASGTTGPERKTRMGDGVNLYADPHGSYRFVFETGGRPVSALQVMSADGKHGHVTNAYTSPDFRRQGLASLLLAKARKRFSTLSYSEDRSEDGQDFVAASS